MRPELVFRPLAPDDAARVQRFVGELSFRAARDPDPDLLRVELALA